MPITFPRLKHKAGTMKGVVIALLLPWSSQFCHAQSHPNDQVAQKAADRVTESKSMQDIPSPDPASAGIWRFNVGLGLMSTASFSGSQEKRTLLMPQFGANYGRLMIGQFGGAETPSLGIGYSLIDTPQWRFGVGVGSTLINVNRGQNMTQNSALGEIPRTVNAALFGSYRFGIFSLNANVASDIGGHQEGTMASLGLMANLRLTPDWSITMGPRMTWVNSEYAKTFYGVTTEQSAASGYQTYQASSGVNGVQFGVGSQYKLTKQLDLGARIGISQPKNDAANSSIADKGIRTGLGVSLNYHF